ncbi:MAG TPA: TetR family transcriptional regulator [Streptosporangiaceae bacterium]|nr:TetR family transcriptional regulator [Streptosporangiaceae bacterium]
MKTPRPATGEPPASRRDRRKDRTRRMIQAEALRLFADKGFAATTIEEIAAAADVAPRTFFRYFPAKEEVVFWADYQPTLAAFVAARPGDEPAVQALCHGIVDGLAGFYDQDRERLLERIKLAFRTPALHPRLRQQQADWAAAMTALLAARLGARPDDLEVRAMAAAIAAALFVAIEEWQARDGQPDLRALFHRALGSVLAGPVPATATPKRR